MNTLTHDVSKPFRMRTYARIGGGGRGGLVSATKIEQPPKLLGIIFLYKKRNNFCGTKLFQKNRVGVHSRIT
jgi:hypothetical protein